LRDNLDALPPIKQQAKAVRRRLARDRRRQENLGVPVEHEDAADVSNCKIFRPELEVDTSSQGRTSTSLYTRPDGEDRPSSLAPWHAPVLFLPVAAIEVDEARKSPLPSYGSISPIASTSTASDDIATPTTLDAVASTKAQRCLIAEVLVVWKLPLKEAFLDFDGFSLERSPLAIS
jgi:hypothetical protein